MKSCYDKALELLALRNHFVAELDAKLRKRQYPVDEIEKAVDRLLERGFLDDAAAAAELVAVKRRRGFGRRRLRAELVRRRVDDAVIDAALAPIDDDSELEAARQAAERWEVRRPSGGRADEGARSKALGRHLERKGYEQRVILAVLQEDRS